MSMQKMMKEMQKMQKNMAKLQEELAQTPVEGSSGGGVVKVTVNGASEMLKVEIDKDLLDPDEVEMLQDLIVAATNDAINRANKMSEEKMASLTKGMKMPGMGGMF